jgi:replicative DNA helicase
MSLLDKAKQYLNAGLSVMPTKADKFPANLSQERFQKKPPEKGFTWKPLQTDPLTESEADTVFTDSNVKGVGIITGAVSGNLEAIDVDCKYDLTGSLWTELKSLIDEHLSEKTAKSLVIAKTRNGGFHIYYRSTKIEGSLKLANRPTTPEEKAETYRQAIAKGEPEEKARKQSAKDKVKVLLETRGEGGYVVADPTPGYEFIQGDASQIPTITPEEREILFTLARSFNELPEPEPKQTDYVKTEPYVNNGLSPFDDYNQRADIPGLLEANGWKQVGRSGDRIYFKRPGNTDSKTSANYHTGLKTFYVFSTSTEFENGKGYNPTGVYTFLECNGDFSLASRRLYEQGYGDRHQSKTKQKPTQVKTDLIRVEAITEIGETITLSKPGDTLKIEKLIAGELKKIYVYYESEDAGAEVLRALDLLDSATETKPYIIQTDDLTSLTNKQSSQPPYEFRLQTLLQHYGKLEENKGSLDAEDIDSLLADAVTIAANLREPTDRDRFTKLFTTLEAVKDLGITEESLRATEEKLRYKAEQEKKEKDLARLLDAATELKEKGDVRGAFTKLEESLNAQRRDSGKDLLPPALTSEDILSRIAETAPAFKTGYKDLDKFVGFTPGAITLVAGRPSHGKTTFMFNLLLEMSRAYAPEDYKFYFFTYEEPLKNLSVKLLNRLVGADLSQHYGSFTALARPTNYEFLKAYVKAERADIDVIEKGKEAFRTFIDSGLITVIDRNYSVEELASLIAYQSQREKIGAVFIDYIQRMRTERRTQDKRTEIAHISDQVLQIAKENNLPLILGAQLNRSTLTGGIKKPSLENLKEAGNLEEDANTVLSVYNESREKDEDSGGTSYSKQREVDLEIKALKNREGEVNQTAILTFDKWTGVIKEKTATANHF